VTKSRARASEKEIVLLGLVAEESIHGHGLERKIRERHIAEWTDIALSSIYRVLDELQRKRLIRTKLVQAGQGAARKVHEITERGRDALAAGVAAFLNDMSPMKTPMSVGLAFAPNGRHTDVLKGLEARAAAVAEAELQIENISAQFHGDLPPLSGVNNKGVDRPHWLGAHLLFDHFRRHVRAEREFLIDAIRLLASSEGHTYFVSSASTKASCEREVES
jgi:DNA-binding PadR family transcriptional regulator